MKIQLSTGASQQNLQVADGTYLEEPGSGAVATIDNKKVSIGTLEWITRYLSLILLPWSKDTQNYMYFKFQYFLLGDIFFT